MYEKITSFYPVIGTEKKEYVATLTKHENKHCPGAVSHVIGSEEISIRSTAQRGYGAIPIKGVENLKMLRDALIKICEMENIK